MEDFDNQICYVKYSSFNVGDELRKYKVMLLGFFGNVGEIFVFYVLNFVLFGFLCFLFIIIIDIFILNMNYVF